MKRDYQSVDLDLPTFGATVTDHNTIKVYAFQPRWRTLVRTRWFTLLLTTRGRK